MIFYLNSAGEIIDHTPSVVNQWSNRANEIYVVAPFSANTQVSIKAGLPNANVVSLGYMELKNDLSNEIINGNELGLCVWGYLLPVSVTSIAGTVKFQFAFKTLSETLTSQMALVEVRQGVDDTEELPESDSDVIDDILSDMNELFDNKVDKETGKGLSTNDFTNAYKNKLDEIDVNAEENQIDEIIGGDNISVSKTGKSVTVSVNGIENENVPTEYLKSATVSANGKSLTLTKEDDSTVSFTLPETLNEEGYELIEKIIVGYSVLTEEPEDFQTAYSSYYVNTGTLKDPTYTALSSAKTFEVGKYYSLDANGSDAIQREKEPDGRNYNFKDIVIYNARRVPGSFGNNWTITSGNQTMNFLLGSNLSLYNGYDVSWFCHKTSSIYLGGLILGNTNPSYYTKYLVNETQNNISAFRIGANLGANTVLYVYAIRG